MAENTPDVVTVSVIGANTAPGALAPLPSGTVAKTPAGIPNVLVNVVRPITAILVRAAHVFVVTFLGALGAGSVGATPADWTWLTALSIAGGAAFLETAKNLVTILGDLEQKNPLLTGSI